VLAAAEKQIVAVVTDVAGYGFASRPTIPTNAGLIAPPSAIYAGRIKK